MLAQIEEQSQAKLQFIETVKERIYAQEQVLTKLRYENQALRLEAHEARVQAEQAQLDMEKFRD